MCNSKLRDQQLFIYLFYCWFFHSYNITLSFRTVSTVAILLYTQSFLLTDFLALEIREGVLKYTYNLGTGVNPIISQPPDIRYDDDVIHTVRLNVAITCIIKLF